MERALAVSMVVQVVVAAAAHAACWVIERAAAAVAREAWMVDAVRQVGVHEAAAAHRRRRRRILAVRRFYDR